MSNVGKLETHIDGEWYTSNHSYNGRLLQIKMREHSGCKIHIFNENGTGVTKTFKFNFATEQYLLDRAKKWIDNLKN